MTISEVGISKVSDLTISDSQAVISNVLNRTIAAGNSKESYRIELLNSYGRRSRLNFEHTLQNLAHPR